MIWNHQQDKQDGGNAAIETRWPDAIAALAAELLAWSDALDRARADGIAFGRSQLAAVEALGREREARAWDEGYAAAVADVKRAEHGLAAVFAEAAEAERGRWVVRGEVRTRATFGAPHGGDYRGGPVAWPDVPGEGGGGPDRPPARRRRRQPRPTSAAGNSRAGGDVDQAAASSARPSGRAA